MSEILQKTCAECGEFDISVNDSLNYSENHIEERGYDFVRSARYVLQRERDGEAHVLIKQVFSSIMSGSQVNTPEVLIPSFTFLCTCKNCGHRWDESCGLIETDHLVSGLKRLRRDYTEQTTSALVGFDCSTLSKYCGDSDWKSLLTNLVFHHLPDEWHKIIRVDQFISRYPSDWQPYTEEVKAIALLLYTISVGMISNLLSDLVKSKSQTIRDVLSREKVRDFAIQKSKTFLDQQFQELRGSLDVRVYPSPELVTILAAMPTEKREAIVDDIALQHAMLIRDDLLKTCDNHNGNLGSPI